MKKEDFQDAQQGSGNAENKDDNRHKQKNQSVNVSNRQQNNIAHQAGLGRDRMADIEDLGGLSGRDDYAGGDSDNRDNQNTNSGTNQ